MSNSLANVHCLTHRFSATTLTYCRVGDLFNFGIRVPTCTAASRETLYKLKTFKKPLVLPHTVHKMSHKKQYLQWHLKCYKFERLIVLSLCQHAQLQNRDYKYGLCLNKYGSSAQESLSSRHEAGPTVTRGAKQRKVHRWLIFRAIHICFALY